MRPHASATAGSATLSALGISAAASASANQEVPLARQEDHSATSARKEVSEPSTASLCQSSLTDGEAGYQYTNIAQPPDGKWSPFATDITSD